MSETSPETGWGSASPLGEQYLVTPRVKGILVPVTDLGGPHDRRVSATGVELMVTLTSSGVSVGCFPRSNKQTPYTQLIDEISPAGRNEHASTLLAFKVAAGAISLSALYQIKYVFSDDYDMLRLDQERTDRYAVAVRAYEHLYPGFRVLSVENFGDERDGYVREAGLDIVVLLNSETFEHGLNVLTLDAQNPIANALIRIAESEQDQRLPVGTYRRAVEAIIEGTFSDRFSEYIDDPEY